MRWYSILLLTFLIGLLFVQTSPAITYALKDAESYEDIDSQGQEKEGQEKEQKEKEGEEKESEKFLEWQVGLPSSHLILYTSNHFGANRLYHSLYNDIIIPPPEWV